MIYLFLAMMSAAIAWGVGRWIGFNDGYEFAMSLKPETPVSAAGGSTTHQQTEITEAASYQIEAVEADIPQATDHSTACFDATLW